MLPDSARETSPARPADPAARERRVAARRLLREASLELARLRRVRGAYRKTWRRIAGAQARLAFAAALLLGAGVPEPAFAETPIFKSPIIASVGAYASPALADIDGDGDLDAFVGNLFGSTFFFENTGTTSTPAFVPPPANTFGLTNVGALRASPALADIDGDGDLDALIGSAGNIIFFANTGTTSTPAFATPSISPFGLAYVGYFTSPAFADIDGDGDLDAFVGGYYGYTAFLENTGTASGPAFAAPSINPFGLADVGYDASPAFADVDGDGDLDAFVGDRYGNTTFFENTGTARQPAFAASSISPFGLADVGANSSPVLADIDGDGDLDAFVGQSLGNTSFFKNTGSAGAPVFAAPSTNPFGLADVGSNASPVLADIDIDGDLDALVGQSLGNTSFFRNTGSAGAPAFAAPSTNPFGLADVGANASPVLADIDGDGDLDALMGESLGNTFFFRNTGSAGAPAFAAPSINPFGLADVGESASPDFADIDGDGDLDAFVGGFLRCGSFCVDFGQTTFFENTGAASAPAFATPSTSLFAVEPGASPALADIDGDGDLDAFVGDRSGRIFFLEKVELGPGKCSDGIDNDLDGRIDFGSDPGCESAADPNERSARQCDDGGDNDGDGKIDWRGDGTGDPHCASLSDESEAEPPCADGLDNDEDGRIDFPADPGCASGTDLSERSGRACDNGLDDDGDGRIDWRGDGTGDTYCVNLTDDHEDNQPPDCSSASTPLGSLWPPDGRFAEVPIVVSEPDREPVSIRVDEIRQDEPTGGSANRISGADGWGIGSDLARLRAERSALGNGRVYQIRFMASDPRGMSCGGSVSVCVPHHRGASCSDEGPLHDSSRPPSLDASDPIAGSAAVVRTSWIRLALTTRIRKPGAIELWCGGARVDAVTTAIDSRTAIINPKGELPPAVLCSVRYFGSRGPEEFFFQVAPGGGSETVFYDRSNPNALLPFPDDYWLVDDPSTPSGKHIEITVPRNIPGGAGNPRAVAAAISDRDGFSPIQDVLFGLSAAADPASFPRDEFGSIDPAATAGIFDTEPSSPEFGERIPFTPILRSDVASDGTLDHTGLLYPARRLEPGRRYAFAVTRRLHAAGDPTRPFLPSPFFERVAGPASADDSAEVLRARDSIAPVLDFLATVPRVPIHRDDVALAVSFSIRTEAFDPSDLVAIKEAYLATPPPELEVHSVTPLFGRAALVQGTVSLPIYLDLDNPTQLYRDPLSGEPAPYSFDSVPFVLTLPEAAFSGPVPIVFYQHGSPGSPYEILDPRMEFLDDAGYAIGGIQDYPNRTFGEDITSQFNAFFITLLIQNRLPLFDLQSRADMLGFLRAIQGLGGESWLPVFSPDGVPEIDPSRILFRGISQGSNHSLAFLPLAPEITAAVSLVGSGRSAETLLHQFPRIPASNPGIRPSQVLWNRAALTGDFDRQDSHFLARHLYREPLVVNGQSDVTPPSLLWIEGIGDSLIPNNATRAAANELGIPTVRPVQRATPVLEQVDAPLAGNPGPDLTAGHFQYDPFTTPSCRDLFLEFEGHQCPQIALEAEAQILHFFETALDPDVPAEIIDPFLEELWLSEEEARSRVRSFRASVVED